MFLFIGVSAVVVKPPYMYILLNCHLHRSFPIIWKLSLGQNGGLSNPSHLSTNALDIVAARYQPFIQTADYFIDVVCWIRVPHINNCPEQQAHRMREARLHFSTGGRVPAVRLPFGRRTQISASAPHPSAPPSDRSAAPAADANKHQHRRWQQRRFRPLTYTATLGAAEPLPSARFREPAQTGWRSEHEARKNLNEGRGAECNILVGANKARGEQRHCAGGDEERGEGGGRRKERRWMFAKTPLGVPENVRVSRSCGTRLVSRHRKVILLVSVVCVTSNRVRGRVDHSKQGNLRIIVQHFHEGISTVSG